MKALITFFLLVLVSSCANKKKSEFVKEKACSRRSISYLKSPRNQTKRYLKNPILAQDVANTQSGMQQCYEDFKKRTGKEEFKTCLVVGINRHGLTEYFDFHSKDVKLDRQFIKCAKRVQNKIPYHIYGSNYIVIQSYDFFYQ